MLIECRQQKTLPPHNQILFPALKSFWPGHKDLVELHLSRIVRILAAPTRKGVHHLLDYLHVAKQIAVRHLGCTIVDSNGVCSSDPAHLGSQ